MGYDLKTKNLALELAKNIETGKDVDINECKKIFLNNFDVLFTVLEIWADYKKYKALKFLKKSLTDMEKERIKLEMLYEMG